MLATKAGKKTTKKADEAFKDAVSKLGEYEKECHKMETVAKRIKTAEEVDKSSLKALNSLEQSRVREELITFLHYTLTLISSHWRRDRRRKLIFLSTSPFQIQSPLLLHVSADSLLLLMVSKLYPNLIPEVLCSRSDQNEILWNFSRFKDERRLTLKENPRFYEVLPTLPENYRNNFIMEPIEVAFLEPIKRKSISVLADKSGKVGGRVFLKITKARAFENAWDLKNAIVFKGTRFSFFIPSHLLTSSQTFLESLREKASSVQPSKTHPTYGVLRNLRRLAPLDRRIGVVHPRPRLQHRRLPQQGYY
jgi:hypothetical protein